MAERGTVNAVVAGSTPAPTDPQVIILDQLIERCHKHHISSISVGGLHLTFEANAHDRSDKAIGDGFYKKDPKPKPVGDDVMFMVSG